MKKQIKTGYLIYLIVFLITTIPLVVLRSIQLMYYTNFASGFYNGPDLLSNVFFIIILAGILFFLIMSITQRGEYKIELYKKKNSALKITSLIAAVFSFINSLYILTQGIIGEKQILIHSFTIIIGLLSSISFLYIYKKIGIKSTSNCDLLVIVPALWCVIELLSMFLDHMAVTTVYENMLNILRASFLTIFLINFAKVLCGTDTKLTPKLLIFSGLSTAMIGFTVTLSQYVILFYPLITQGKLGEGYTNSHVLAATPFDLVITIFSTIFTFIYLKDRVKKQKEQI